LFVQIFIFFFEETIFRYKKLEISSMKILVDINRCVTFTFKISRKTVQTSCRLIASTRVLSADMSMYFFRLHNLRRQAEEVRKKRQKQSRGSQGGQLGTNHTDQSQPTAGTMQCFNRVHRGPSKLFERAPLQPSDSLDEIAFQIPR